MVTKPSRKKLFGFISTALSVAILMQWLIIPKIQFGGVIADTDSERYVPDKFDSANLVNFETILGGAVDYGIVADTLNQTGHSETTFAVNYYSTSANNDVDYVTDTAHFIIGQGFSTTGEAQEVFLGKSRACSVIFEGPQSVFGYYAESGDPMDLTAFQNIDGNRLSGHDSDTPYSETITNGRLGNFRFNNEFQFGSYPESEFIQTVNDSASVNVNRIINRIRGEVGNTGRSEEINTRASANSDYVLNPDGDACYWFGGQNGRDTAIDPLNHYGIYINDSEFANRVVYINVTPNMLTAIQNGGLEIHKIPSTVVVFNFPASMTDVTIKNPKLTVYSEDDPSTVLIPQMDSDTATNGKGWDEENGCLKEKEANVERYFNHSVVWNVMGSGTVELAIVAGVMLCPNANLVKLTGQSTGWLVAGGTVNTTAEMHYLFNGGSSDTLGEMHFSLRKSFIDLTGAEDRSLQFNAGDIEFTMFNADSNYSITSVFDNSPVDALSVVNFDEINFLSGDYLVEAPQPGEEPNVRVFYFVIKETKCTVPGYSMLSDEIRIQLTVTRSGANNFTYGVVYSSTGSQSISGNVPVMSGAQFDLGAFRNVAASDGDITINKTVVGCNAADGHEYLFDVYNADSSGAPTGNAVRTNVPLTVSEDAATGAITGSASVTGLPLGDYVVVESATSAVIAGYILDSTETHSAVVTVSTGSVDADITNTYTQDQQTGSLTVTKVIDGVPAADITAQTFTFDVYEVVNGTRATTATTQITVNVAAGQNQVTSAPVTVPVGTYEIVEVTPASDIGTYAYQSVAYSPADGRVTVTAGSTAAASVTATNTYATTQVFGDIEINKTVLGCSTAAGHEFMFDVYEADASGAPVGRAVRTNVTLTVAEDAATGAITGTASVTNLPAGRYVVVESATSAAIAGYTLDPNETHSVVVTVSTGSVDADITNTYTQQTGGLVVTKVITGMSASEVTTAQTFTFNVYEVVNGTRATTATTQVEVTVGVGQLSGTSAEISLPAGTYEIEEVTPTSNIGTYEYQSVTYSPADGRVTVTAGSTTAASVTATNTYGNTTVFGNLVVTKTLSDGTDAINAVSDMTFYVLLTDSDGNYYNVNGGQGSADAPIAITVNSGNSYGTLEFIHLDVSKTYTVREVTATGAVISTATAVPSIDGYTFNVSGSNLSDQASAFSTAGATPTASASITNKYDQNQVTTYGDLIITKTIAGGVDLANLSVISFTVTGPSTVTIPNLTAANVGTGANQWSQNGNTYTFTVSNVETGSYTVTESANGATTEWTIDTSASTTAPQTATVADTAAQTVAAAFINTYVQQQTTTYGDLTITKTISGYSVPQGETFTFYVSVYDGTNYYDASGNTQTSVYPIAITVSGGSTGTVVVPGLDTSKTYTITEVTSTGSTVSGVNDVPTISGYTFKPGDSTLNTTATFAAGATTASAGVTNKYEADTVYGNIDVTKVLSGCTSGTALTFYVTLSDASGNYYDTNGNTTTASSPIAVTVAAGQTSGTVQFVHLDVSKTYTVTEVTATGAAITAVTDVPEVTGYTFNVSGSGLTAQASAFSTAGATPTASASITNKYDQNQVTTYTGDLVITKKITGVTDLATLGNITFSISPAIGSVSTLTLDPDNITGSGWTVNGDTFTYTFTGLTQGDSYTVTETADGTSGATVSYTVVTTSPSGAVTIPTDTTQITSVTAAFTNAYTDGGSTPTTPTTPTSPTTPTNPTDTNPTGSPDGTTPTGDTTAPTESTPETTAPEISSVTLDGQPIEPGSYEPNPDGSITLNESIRRTLDPGPHTIIVTYVNGATRTFTYNVDGADRTLGATGETSVNAVAAILMLGAIVCVFVSRKLREEEEEK